MIDITFEINGRKVDPNNMKEALESAVLSAVAEQIETSVGGLTCPEHGESPKIKVEGRTIHTLSFEVSGCCDALVEQVKAKLE